MESLKWKFLSLALVASMSFLTSCSDDDNNGGNDNGEVETLKGTITSDVTLKAGTTYKLSGEYIVEAGATLNIEAGVKIISVYDDIVDYILIKQGAKINAMGTANAPIVMTSEKEEPGAWGGIHICGKHTPMPKEVKEVPKSAVPFMAATTMPTTPANCNMCA